jgi:hypothetical protein
MGLDEFSMVKKDTVWQINPELSAVLVIDMLNDFLAEEYTPFGVKDFASTDFVARQHKMFGDNAIVSFYADSHYGIYRSYPGCQPVPGSKDGWCQVGKATMGQHSKNLPHVF